MVLEPSVMRIHKQDGKVAFRNGDLAIFPYVRIEKYVNIGSLNIQYNVITNTNISNYYEYTGHILCYDIHKIGGWLFGLFIL